MAISRSWILSLKFIFLSITVLFIAMLLKFSVPLIIDFIIYQLPSIWEFIASWLKPPYLYLIINCIIISIVASSSFHQRSDSYDDLFKSSVIDLEFELQSEESRSTSRSEDEDEFVISRSNWTPSPRTNSPEKPMALSRFSNRKPARISPEAAKVLKVAKPKKNETLENTWKTITDGRHVPLTRHLKKSETFENYGCQNDGNESPKNRIMKKSETFRDRTNYCNNSPPSSTSVSPSPGKMRREPSLSHDELNRRVEAFIKKFNDEMRLQRQDSLKQYSKMMSGGIR
ncbi:uncharacterized protein LOC124911277 [Impatiens glandulifera]|uniref:uncharacterized protein LOC124911277 n=1 Tax=Impatiens glandulifera TaxID=253017 RepID=UPI001FB052A4|nr:uncharacterized protein LOC124911277 [Impatiens glandulifera]